MEPVTSTPTGKRGRPKGAKNKITEHRQRVAKKLAKEIELKLPNSFSGNAHALLMLVYKDASLPLETRIDAAKSAIRYETPALQATELTGKDGAPLLPAPPVINVQFVSPDSNSNNSDGLDDHAE